MRRQITGQVLIVGLAQVFQLIINVPTRYVRAIKAALGQTFGRDFIRRALACRPTENRARRVDVTPGDGQNVFGARGQRDICPKPFALQNRNERPLAFEVRTDDSRSHMRRPCWGNVQGSGVVDLQACDLR
ncbi:hypothetical protein NJB1907E78_34510 [Mycobacterium marinum]|nr:hypothetical protein NJB1728e24_01550 [Mycobacterium marinum]GJO50886.1 hypothetical protein NJB1907f3_27610 [Mycobacterium marinum]GJO70681.1 hypothetical protein NJB1728f10_45260 [Mycobacterium marinum]GJP05870.1 hypothetical protein NJB1907E78_34510 [Mycobacterium marinum]GJP18376.1 hypothetical protein NJB1907E8_11520 [Mycobacterium marinum]